MGKKKGKKNRTANGGTPQASAGADISSSQISSHPPSLEATELGSALAELLAQIDTIVSDETKQPDDAMEMLLAIEKKREVLSKKITEESALQIQNRVLQSEVYFSIAEQLLKKTLAGVDTPQERYVLEEEVLKYFSWVVNIKKSLGDEEGLHLIKGLIKESERRHRITEVEVARVIAMESVIALEASDLKGEEAYLAITDSAGKIIDTLVKFESIHIGSLPPEDMLTRLSELKEIHVRWGRSLDSAKASLTLEQGEQLKKIGLGIETAIHVGIGYFSYVGSDFSAVRACVEKADECMRAFDDIKTTRDVSGLLSEMERCDLVGKRQKEAISSLKSGVVSNAAKSVGEGGAAAGQGGEVPSFGEVKDMANRMDNAIAGTSPYPNVLQDLMVLHKKTSAIVEANHYAVEAVAGRKKSYDELRTEAFVRSTKDFQQKILDICSDAESDKTKEGIKRTIEKLTQLEKERQQFDKMVQTVPKAFGDDQLTPVLEKWSVGVRSVLQTNISCATSTLVTKYPDESRAEKQIIARLGIAHTLQEKFDGMPAKDIKDETDILSSLETQFMAPEKRHMLNMFYAAESLNRYDEHVDDANKGSESFKKAEEYFQRAKILTFEAVELEKSSSGTAFSQENCSILVLNLERLAVHHAKNAQARLQAIEEAKTQQLGASKDTILALAMHYIQQAKECRKKLGELMAMKKQAFEKNEIDYNSIMFHTGSEAGLQETAFTAVTAHNETQNGMVGNELKQIVNEMQEEMLSAGKGSFKLDEVAEEFSLAHTRLSTLANKKPSTDKTLTLLDIAIEQPVGADAEQFHAAVKEVTERNKDIQDFVVGRGPETGIGVNDTTLSKALDDLLVLKKQITIIQQTAGKNACNKEAIEALQRHYDSVKSNVAIAGPSAAMFYFSKRIDEARSKPIEASLPELLDINEKHAVFHQELKGVMLIVERHEINKDDAMRKELGQLSDLYQCSNLGMRSTLKAELGHLFYQHRNAGDNAEVLVGTLKEALELRKSFYGYARGRVGTLVHSVAGQSWLSEYSDKRMCKELLASTKRNPQIAPEERERIKGLVAEFEREREGFKHGEESVLTKEDKKLFQLCMDEKGEALSPTVKEKLRETSVEMLKVIQGTLRIQGSSEIEQASKERDKRSAVRSYHNGNRILAVSLGVLKICEEKEEMFVERAYVFSKLAGANLLLHSRPYLSNKKDDVVGKAKEYLFSAVAHLKQFAAEERTIEVANHKAVSQNQELFEQVAKNLEKVATLYAPGAAGADIQKETECRLALRELIGGRGEKSQVALFRKITEQGVKQTVDFEPFRQANDARLAEAKAKAEAEAEAEAQAEAKKAKSKAKKEEKAKKQKAKRIAGEAAKVGAEKQIKQIVRGAAIEAVDAAKDRIERIAAGIEAMEAEKAAVKEKEVAKEKAKRKEDFLSLEGPEQLVKEVDYVRNLLSGALEEGAEVCIKGSNVFRHALAPRTQRILEQQEREKRENIRKEKEGLEKKLAEEQSPEGPEKLKEKRKLLEKQEPDLDVEIICAGFGGTILDKDLPGKIRELLKLREDVEIQEVRGWRGDFKYGELFAIHSAGFRIRIPSEEQETLKSANGENWPQWVDVVIRNPKFPNPEELDWSLSPDVVRVKLSSAGGRIELCPDFVKKTGMNLSQWFDSIHCENECIINRDNMSEVRMKKFTQTLLMKARLAQAESTDLPDVASSGRESPSSTGSEESGIVLSPRPDSAVARFAGGSSRRSTPTRKSGRSEELRRSIDPASILRERKGSPAEHLAAPNSPSL